MSLDHLLLGLCRTPSSGYDLKKVFDAAIRYFWPAELSQMYPKLRQLQRRGWLTCRTVPPARGPRRRLYQTTAAGCARLRAWLEAGPAFRDERYVFAAQIFLLDALADLDQSAAFVRRLRQELARRREALAAIAADGASPGAIAALGSEDFHHYLCLRLGLRVLDARIAWCDEALQAIRRRRARARATTR